MQTNMNLLRSSATQTNLKYVICKILWFCFKKFMSWNVLMLMCKLWTVKENEICGNGKIFFPQVAIANKDLHT